MSSGPNAFQPLASIPVRLYEEYVGRLAEHRNDPLTGKCPVCQVKTCPEWRQLMAVFIATGTPIFEPKPKA